MDDLPAILICTFLIAAIAAGLGACAIDARRDRAFIEHGYSQKLVPGSTTVIWVKD